MIKNVLKEKIDHNLDLMIKKVDESPLENRARRYREAALLHSLSTHMVEWINDPEDLIIWLSTLCKISVSTLAMIGGEDEAYSKYKLALDKMWEDWQKFPKPK